MREKEEGRRKCVKGSSAKSGRERGEGEEEETWTNEAGEEEEEEESDKG